MSSLWIEALGLFTGPITTWYCIQEGIDKYSVVCRYNMVNFLHNSHIKHSKACHKFIKFLNFSRPGRPFLNPPKFSDFQDPVRNGHQKPMQIMRTPMVWLFHKAGNVQLSAAVYLKKQSILSQNLQYKVHQIPKFKCISFRLAIVFAQSIEARS